MRRPSFRPQQSAMVMLILANVAAFIAQNFIPPQILRYLPLSIQGLQQGYLWQLLSFQFLHAGIWHLLGNCLALFWFGRSVEEALGRKSFVSLYFVGGVIGGLVQVLSMLLFHENGYVLGASAGAFGVTAAYAILFPDSVLLLFFFIPMPAKFLLILEAGISIGGIARLSMFDPSIAHAAHLGGMITGIIFVRYAVHWRLRWPQLKRPGRRPLRPLVKVHSQKPAWAQTRPDASEDLPAEEFLSKEVDPILDKISAHGIQSLTERERRILEKARAKMAKR